jgi:hypothetical protein
MPEVVFIVTAFALFPFHLLIVERQNPRENG